MGFGGTGVTAIRGFCGSRRVGLTIDFGGVKTGLFLAIRVGGGFGETFGLGGGLGGESFTISFFSFLGGTSRCLGINLGRLSCTVVGCGITSGESRGTSFPGITRSVTKKTEHAMTAAFIHRLKRRSLMSSSSLSK